MMQLPDKDNEFDDLIKAAADKYKAPGADPDWDKMQTMLDTHMPVSKRPQRRGWYFLLIPLFLLLGGVYIYFNTNNDNSIKPVREQKAVAKAPGPASSKAVTDSMTMSTGNDNQKKQKSLSQNKETLKTKETALLSQKAGVNIKNVTAGNSKKSLASLLQNKKTFRQNEAGVNRNNFVRLQNKSKGGIKTNINQAEVIENNTVTEKTKEETSSISKNETVINTPDKTTDSATLNKIAGTPNNKSSEKNASPQIITAENKITASAKNTAGDKSKATKRKNPLEFSLLYAPEFTTIGFSNIDKPGSNYGILVGYSISKNISLQTGIIKSKKNYIANGADYKSNYFVMPPFKLTRVKGYCNMYEIPVNIKYDLSRRKNITVSAIAGISSYFMTSEYYSFQYNSYDSAYNRSREYGSQKNYWLALATIAVGFEKQVSNNLSVGAAPFLKIPFKGMGSGNLKLIGTGINFSLSYRPSFKK